MPDTINQGFSIEHTDTTVELYVYLSRLKRTQSAGIVNYQSRFIVRVSLFVKKR